jgi:hypothetical protein
MCGLEWRASSGTAGAESLPRNRNSPDPVYQVGRAAMVELVTAQVPAATARPSTPAREEHGEASRSATVISSTTPRKCGVDGGSLRMADSL